MRPLTEKQELLVGRLIVRAERKHAKGKMDLSGLKFGSDGGGEGTSVDINAIVAAVMDRIEVPTTDVGELAKEVLKRISGSEVVNIDAIANIVLKKMEERAPRKVEISCKSRARPPRSS
jgi:hypothetical protein